MSALDPWTAPSGITFSRALSVSELAAARSFHEAHYVNSGGGPGCPQEMSSLIGNVIDKAPLAHIVGRHDGEIVLVATFHEDPDYRPEDHIAVMVGYAATGVADAEQVYREFHTAMWRYLNWEPDHEITVVSVEHKWMAVLRDICGEYLIEEQIPMPSFLTWEGDPPALLVLTVQVQEGWVQDARAL